jgi:hypothetical protein
LNKDIAKILLLDVFNLGHKINREESLKIAGQVLGAKHPA